MPEVPSTDATRAVSAAPVRALADLLRRQRGLRRLVIAFAAGAVSILAMAPYHLSPVLAVTLPVLLVLITSDPGSSARRVGLQGFGAGWAFGFGYHVVGLSWIGEAFLVEADVFQWLLPFAVTLLPAAMALYWALGCAAAALVLRWGGPQQSALWRVAVLALAFGAAEWLRGHLFTGFPWNVVGYALTHPLLLLQAAGVFGIYGLTVLAVLIFATPLTALAAAPAEHSSDIRWREALLPPALILVSLALYGGYRLQPTPTAREGAKIRIVQPSIPQREKWRPELQRRFFEDHLVLSGQAEDGRQSFDGITHIVWPEASMPFGPLRSPEALAMIRDRLPTGVVLIAGALRADDQPLPGQDRRRAFNSLLALGSDANLVALYDKIHLVPFGEYLPFQSTLEAIGLEQLSRMRGGFSSGVTPRPLLAVPGLPPLGVLICYEAIFPAAVVQGTARPGLIINITNDGWFGRTIGPYQHLQQTRVRAVEEGVALVRAANNGISAMFDPYGRSLGELGIDARATLDRSVPGVIDPPVFAKRGNTAFFLLGITITLALVWFRRQRR